MTLQISNTIALDLDNEVGELRAELEMVRAAWLHWIKIENECANFSSKPNGLPCPYHKCACALEMQGLIDAFGQTGGTK